MLCTNGTTVDGDLYRALHTELDTHAAYDLLDLQEIHSSWASAARSNAAMNQG